MRILEAGPTCWGRRCPSAAVRGLPNGVLEDVRGSESVVFCINAEKRPKSMLPPESVTATALPREVCAVCH